MPNINYDLLFFIEIKRKYETTPYQFYSELEPPSVIK